MRTSLQVARSFVALINAQDVDGILAACTTASRFFVEGESPTVGHAHLRTAWAGYFEAFPDYVVYVDEEHERADATYLVGHTTGSQVASDLEQIPSSVIWRCEVEDDLVAEWSIYPATDANRRRFDLPPPRE